MTAKSKSKKPTRKQPKKAARRGAPRKQVTDANAHEGGPQPGSKQAKIEQALRSGLTLAAMMKMTNWQAHSCRGFLSVARKRGLEIESEGAGKDRTYRIA